MTTPTIPMTACESSNVAAHGYDATTKTLALQFKSGGLYHYHDVPADVAAGLTEAKSIGQYVGQSIKNQFKHSKIPSE